MPACVYVQSQRKWRQGTGSHLPHAAALALLLLVLLLVLLLAVPWHRRLLRVPPLPPPRRPTAPKGTAPRRRNGRPG